MKKRLDFPIILTEEKFYQLENELATTITIQKMGADVLIPNPDGSGTSVFNKDAEIEVKRNRVEVKEWLWELFELGRD